jgi:hypothetical protein
VSHKHECVNEASDFDSNKDPTYIYQKKKTARIQKEIMKLAVSVVGIQHLSVYVLKLVTTVT